MRKNTLASLLLGLGLPLNAIADAPAVAVDIAPLHSLVSQVMEGAGQPALLIPAEASPHEYNLRPSQARALSDARVVFWIGEELTPWLEKAMDNVAESAQKVSMLELAGTTTHEFREGVTFEKHAHHGDEEHHDEHAQHDEHMDEHDHHDAHHDESDHHHEHEAGWFDRLMSLFSSDDHHDNHREKHDEHEAHEEHHEHAAHDVHEEHEEHEHAHHHDHEGVDPHAWLDPENAKVWVKEIQEVLSKQDPENAGLYANNADQAIASLDRLIQETQSTVNGLGALKFIVFHDAYQYFEKRFGISAAGSISLGDAEDPSPARIAEIRETVKALGVNCVFSEPQYNPGLLNSVFEGTSVTTKGVMDPLGASIQAGAGHYAALIESMVASLAQCNK